MRPRIDSTWLKENLAVVIVVVVVIACIIGVVAAVAKVIWGHPK